MISKSIFTSKTFWLNILGAALIGIWNYLMPDHPIPNIASTGIMSIANIVNRFATQSPVHLV